MAGGLGASLSDRVIQEMKSLSRLRVKFHIDFKVLYLFIRIITTVLQEDFSWALLFPGVSRGCVGCACALHTPPGMAWRAEPGSGCPYDVAVLLYGAS